MRDNISNLIKMCDMIKGEIVLVIEGNNKEDNLNIDYEKEIIKLIKEGYTKRDAIIEVADKYNISKNKLYNLYK